MTEALLYARLKSLMDEDYLPDLIDLCSHEGTHGTYRTDWQKVVNRLADYLAEQIAAELNPVAAPDATGHP